MVVGAGACWLLPGVDDVAMFAWYVGGMHGGVVAGARDRERGFAFFFCRFYVL